MAYQLMFDKSSVLHEGIIKLEAIDGRLVATYADGATIDLGPVENFDINKVSSRAHVSGTTFIVDDNSRLANYETLWGQIVPEARTVHIDGDETIEGTKVFLYGGHGAYEGSIVIQGGSDILGQRFIINHYSNLDTIDSSVAITHDKIFYDYVENGEQKSISANIKDLINLVNGGE